MYCNPSRVFFTQLCKLKISMQLVGSPYAIDMLILEKLHQAEL